MIDVRAMRKGRYDLYKTNIYYEWSSFHLENHHDYEVNLSYLDGQHHSNYTK